MGCRPLKSHTLINQGGKVTEWAVDKCPSQHFSRGLKVFDFGVLIHIYHVLTSHLELQLFPFLSLPSFLSLFISFRLHLTLPDFHSHSPGTCNGSHLARGLVLHQQSSVDFLGSLELGTKAGFRLGFWLLRYSFQYPEETERFGRMVAWV